MKMICVKYYTSVKRVRKNIAENLIKNHGYHYVSKGVYKRFIRNGE